MIEPLYHGVFSATLESGLRILVEEVPSSRSASVGLWINAGSRDDPQSAPGSAHFLEHLMFKGTPSRDAVTISREIDALGGHLNGVTGKESTCYYADLPGDSLPTAIEILADLVQHPTFDPAELELERGVVLEEIRGHDDDPEQYAYALFTAGLWHGLYPNGASPNRADTNRADTNGAHPLSRSVLGDKSTIESVTRTQLIEHHSHLYRPDKMVLAVCGAVNAAAVIELAGDLFTPSPHPPTPVARSRPHLKSGRCHHERKTAQTHVYLALPGADAQDEDRFAHAVVNTIFGGGMSSRLFRLIREERGLAYAVSSSSIHYSDAGFWLIYAGVAPKNAAETVDLVLSQVDRLQQKGITPDELSLAKAKLRGNLIRDLESNSNRMSRLGGAAIAEREILSPDTLIARLDAVSEDDTRRVIARFADADRANLAVVGPATVMDTDA